MGASLPANGVLTPGSEYDLMGIDDPQCASGGPPLWGTRETQDATGLHRPTAVRRILQLRQARPATSPHRLHRQPDVQYERGEPKYGDYNGLATGGGRLLNIWASGTAPSDLPVAPNNNILAYVVVTDLPSDFFVRDWTSDANHHDNGQEPSTNPVFYETSDVWNQTSNTPETAVNDWVQGDSPVRNGSNYAFARVSRRAPAASTVSPVTVTADFLMADFGSGVPFADLGSQTVSFSATDNSLLTPGLPWTVPPTSSTHVCLAVQISAPGDPYLPPSLLGGSPGASGTDPLVLQDNKKAQRNLQVTTGTGGAGGEYYAIVHNTETSERNIVIRYSVDPRAAKYVSSGSLKIVNGKTMDMGKAGRIVLEHMAPGEDRWLGLRFGGISAPMGQPVLFRLYEVTSRKKVVNGFAVEFRREPLPVVSRENLWLQGDVLSRFAAIAHDEELAAEARKFIRLAEGAEGIRPDRYRALLKEAVPTVRRAIEKHAGDSSTSDPFGLIQALKDLEASMASADANASAVAHEVLMQRLDAYLTWKRRGVHTA